MASIVWMLSMGAILSNLREWIDKWAPKELHGGLPGRCGDDFHHEFQEDMMQSLEGIEVNEAKID